MKPLRILAATLLIGITGTVIAQAPKDKPAQPRLKYNAKQIAEAEAKLLQANCSLHHEELPPLVPNGPPVRGEIDIAAFPGDITDAELAKLIPMAARLPKLETIDLGRSRMITSKGFKEVARLIPDLKALFLDGCTVDEDSLKELVSLKQLQWLDLSRSTVSDANLKLLADFPSLQNLTLDQVPALTEAGVAHLQKLPRLRSLHITVNRDPSGMMAHIGKMDMLAELKVSPIGDEEAKEIANLTRLQILDLNNGMNFWRAFRANPVVPDMNNGMPAVVVRPPVAKGPPIVRPVGKPVRQGAFDGISAKGFPHILKCTDLRVLKLAGHSIDVTGSGLDKLEFLQELDLSGTGFSDDGVSWLGRLKLLRKLWLSGTGITNEGVKGLSVAGGLELIALDYLPLTDESISYLARNRKLKELSLNSTRVACADRRAWSGFGRLERVYLEETNITDSTLMNLAPLKTLRLVNARNNCPNISVAGARALQNELTTGASVWAHSCEFAYWPGGGGVPIREPNRGYFNTSNNTRDSGPSRMMPAPTRAPPPAVRLAPLPGTGKP